jgi:hypothetical protein
VPERNKNGLMYKIFFVKFYFNEREWKGQFGPETGKKSSQINNDDIGFLFYSMCYLFVG